VQQKTGKNTKARSDTTDQSTGMIGATSLVFTGWELAYVSCACLERGCLPLLRTGKTGTQRKHRVFLKKFPHLFEV
jgi:hypothetical protein